MRGLRSSAVLWFHVVLLKATGVSEERDENGGSKCFPNFRCFLNDACCTQETEATAPSETFPTVTQDGIVLQRTGNIALLWSLVSARENEKVDQSGSHPRGQCENLRSHRRQVLEHLLYATSRVMCYALEHSDCRIIALKGLRYIL
jgi:hypothetical protein